MNTLRMPVAAMIVAALSLSIFARARGADSAEPPTAREVLERAREAMMPPVQFRIRVGGVESTVSQKEIGEQGLAARTETVAPGFEQTVLVLDGDLYKWTSSNNKGFRVTGFLGGMLAQAQSAAKGAALTDGKASPGATVTFKDPTTIDEEECWVVEEILPSGIIDSMLATLGVAGPIPRGTRSAIGKQSGRLVETTQLWRNDDGPESVTRYSDITPNAELSNELFLPPDDVAFTTVNSIEEYARVDNEATLESLKDFHPWDDVKPLEPPPFDAEKGVYVIPPPPGFTAEEYDAAVSRFVLEDMQREGNRDPGEPTVEERLKALRRSRKPASKPVLPSAVATTDRSRTVISPLILINVGAITLIAWALYRRWITRKSQ